MSDTWDLGEDVPIRLFTRDEDDVLTNADTTPTIALTRPDDTALSPALTFTLTATGTYDTELPAASGEAGLWTYVTTATVGGVVIKEHRQFTISGTGVPSAPLYLDFDSFRESLAVVPSALDGKSAGILRALRAACRKIDRECHRHFYTAPLSARTYALGGNVYFDRREGTSLLLTHDIATETGLAVEVGSAFGSTWTTLDAGSYELWPLSAPAERRPYEGIKVSGRWAGDRARITSRPGWPEIPDEIEMAAQILGSRYYDRRTSPQGTSSGSSDFGGAVPLRRTDPDVAELIKNLVRLLS